MKQNPWTIIYMVTNLCVLDKVNLMWYNDLLYIDQTIKYRSCKYLLCQNLDHTLSFPENMTLMHQTVFETK